MRTARGVLRAAALGAIAIGLLAPASPAHAEPTVAEVQAQIDQKSHELEKVVEQYNKVNEDLKATNAKATQLQQQLPELQGKLDAAYAIVGDLAAQAYKGGGITTASVMLGAGSSDSMLEQLTALDQIARSQRADIRSFTDVKAAYDSQKKQIDATLAQQTATQKDLATRKKSIDGELSKLYDLRRQAYGSATQASGSGSGSGSGGGSAASAPSVSGKAGIAVKYAYGAIGAPYVWAASGPYSAGYDCSGLTAAAWQAAGVSLPHVAASQYDVTTRISRSQLQPGDLVFYSSLGHVGIYVGNGQIIHSPTFGETVKLSPIDMMTPYGYGRV